MNVKHVIGLILFRSRRLLGAFALTMLCVAGARAAGPAAHDAALAYLGAGANAYANGDLAEATREWGRAIQMCRISGDSSLEVDALGRHAEALAGLGQLREAEADLTRALRGAGKSGDAAQLAAVGGALGNVLLRERNFPAARDALERSLFLARQNGLTDVVAASANNLGNVRISLGETVQASESYRESIAAAESAHDVPLAATARTNEARARFRLGDSAGGMLALGAALAAAEAVPESADKAFGLIAVASVARDERPSRGRFEPTPERFAVADAAFRHAASIADAVRDSRAASLANGGLAELAEATGQGASGDAARRVRLAIFQAQAVGAGDLLYRWEWLNARLAKARGDAGAVLPAYRRAIASLEAIRNDIPVLYSAGRSSFRESVGPLYFQFADMLLRAASARGIDPATAESLVLESRDTVETLKTSEVREYFNDPCLTTLSAQRDAGSDVAANKVPARTAIIYPIILPDRTEMIVSLPNGQTIHSATAVSESALTAEARRMRLSLETVDAAVVGPASQLYDWLIRPIEPALASNHVETLVIVPDGALRSIPFSALIDGRDFLVRRYAVATVPSLALTETSARERPRAHVLLSGLSEPVQGYPALPGVDRELGAIDRISANATILKNADYRLSTMDKELRNTPFSVVHIASHGVFGGDSSKSFVLTFDSKLTLNQLEADIKYSRYRDEPLDLLVLSACETAIGDDRAALGLAGVAVKAGARSAVASLWEINDVAAATMMPDFYDGITKAHLSKAMALRRAQLDLMANPAFSHPNFWAPLQLIGNWN